MVSPSGVVYVNTWSGVYYGNDTPPAGGFLVALQDARTTGKADVTRRFGETVQSGGDHPMHPFAIDAEGSLYIDMGTATNSCQPQNRALESPGNKPCTELLTRGGIWRYDANKTDQPFSPAERFATGIRNAEGFAVDSPGHRIFVTQQGRDQLHSNWPAFY